MVMINYERLNQAVDQGNCGGSMCICPDCVKERSGKVVAKWEVKQAVPVCKRCGMSAPFCTCKKIKIW